MPELPEVETITNRLRPYLVGKKIAEVIQHHPKTFVSNGHLPLPVILSGVPAKSRDEVEESLSKDISVKSSIIAKKSILNSQILEVSRKAKMIRIQLENNLNILIHLKMTGQIIYVDDKHRVGGGHPTEDWIAQLPTKHTRVEICFSDNSKMFFNDQRLFGWMKVMSDEEIEKEFAKYAMDVNSPNFTLKYFSEIVKKRSMPIKQLIMDNTIVSGIGNIYACDALNLAQLSPFQKANTLSSDQIESIYNASKSIIQKGIDLGGATTDGKYIDVHGFAGKYQLEARVYDRKGQKCLHCGGEIVKEKLGGRGTYYCSVCQKLET